MYPTTPVTYAPFNWGFASENAALMIAEGRDTLEQIAEFVGISSAKLKAWREHPEFESRIKQFKDELRARVSELAISRVETRIRNMNDRYLGLQKIIRERSDYFEGQMRDGTIEPVPGAKTGLIAQKKRGIGSGGNFEIVTEYVIDVGLLKAIQDLEICAAKMLGQINDKDTLNVSTEAAATRAFSIAELLTPDELSDMIERMKQAAAAKLMRPAIDVKADETTET